MSLSPGTRVGPYEILAQIGAGGMGEVYRARDTRLGRDVAIKTLPRMFVSQPDRISRFRREANTLASLRHPNIAAIYGLEDADGVPALILELINGPTLDERLAEGSIPLSEALLIAQQIAEALEAAHGQGIIHRDLKPANVAFEGPAGTAGDGVRVKVLDFGIAKIAVSEEDRGLLPTTLGTQNGRILGTPAYMSPEQARGHPVDKRTDIWSFGCVLHEMLTGRRTFAGETISDVLASVLTREPDFALLPAATPQPVRRLMRRCLQKDRQKRLHDIADARLEIQEALAEPDSQTSAAARQGAGSLARAIPWVIAALSTLAVMFTYVGSRRTEQPPRPVTRLELAVPTGVELYVGPSAVALSPDGTRVAFVGIEAGNRRLYVRRLDAFETMLVKGSEGATAVFFSPDSRSVAFIRTDRAMRRVSLEEGVVVTLASDVDYSSGGTWGMDDRITFGRDGVLWQVSASGGSATQLTTLDGAKGELLHAFPAESGMGKGILFVTLTDGRSGGATYIDALSLTPAGTRRTRIIDRGTSPAYVDRRHVVFFRGGAVLAVPYDAQRQQLTGPAVKIVDQVGLTATGVPLIAVSRSGSLVYIRGSLVSQLVWASRRGDEQTLSDIGRAFVFPRLSPDGRHLVVSAEGDLWIQNTSRPTLARLTTDMRSGNAYAVWTPDSKRVVFRTNAGLRWIDADGSGRSGAIPQTAHTDFPSSISVDRDTLLFLRTTLSGGADLYVLSLSGKFDPRPIVSTKAHEGGGQFSPDGHWIAYASDESGQFQVLLRPFPGPDQKWPVSQTGKYVTWNPNGKELFYRDGNRMMAVDVAVRNREPVFSAARVLFEQRYEFGTAQTIPNYAVTPDGQQFVMVKPEPGPSRFSVVLNAFDDLTAFAPQERSR